MSDELKRYWDENGLDAVVEAGLAMEREMEKREGAVSDETTLPPDVSDLARLHRIIRTRRCFTVLEFGTGFSTLVMAHALMLNKRDFEALPEKPRLRNSRLFQLFTVDTSEYWMQRSQSRMPEELAALCTFSHSGCTIGTYNGQLCHYYDRIPNVIADFIYLDGPDPEEVKGDVHGLDFSILERTVMSGDLLLMESTFLPGTFILVDGRTNNCRFLARNFQRNYKIEHDAQGDVTTFELDEARLGKLNILGSDLF
ncbi:MAG: hypothetical protein AB7D51_06710 [Desulfovibrionaceae bacterium]